MQITAEAQALFDDLVLYMTSEAARPRATWSPYTDVHERFRVTVCASCFFPEAHHLLARVIGLISSGALNDPPWDDARASRVVTVAADLRRLVAQQVPPEQLEALLMTLRGYALEARPPGASEKDAAGILRTLQETAKAIDSKELQAVVTAAGEWLDRYERQTSETALVSP